MARSHGTSAGTASGRRTRLEDVAARAGVTKSIASRVLNDDPTVSVRPETRERIIQAAVELGYRAHAGARALAGAEARALALLIPDLTNLTYSRIVRGAFQRAREHGYVLLIAEDTGDLATDTSFTDLVSAGRVDGLIVASAKPGDPIVGLLAGRRVPHVFVNRAIPGSGRNVTMDVAAASREAVGHLAGLGHRRIGHVAGPAGIVPALDREAAFLQACRDAGVEACPVQRAEISEEGGYRAALRLLRRHRTVSAVYASTFTQAIGVLRALRELGREVPGDVSVVAFDDLPQADYVDPPLTTVAMPLVELGAAAVDALIGQLRGGAPADVVLAAHPALMLRASTAPARR
ncbi:LacI family DNA-binding transcriptional regulator [Thermoactinospora rubra]|uniref:LacI family DNA-binding transcriptional regulator n=1 Tax=Thermoactinospora rubra TaxID=1088767 RepID=UPI000A118C99|nr:LacI family DNA-binding transcriptional regulator [Thermoactinospora rubra]